jgi:mannose-6-phosphate isomerase-like protein (cupin superfamily)
MNRNAAALLTLILVLTPLANRAATETPVPVYEEPRHRLVYEKGPIRIFNTNIPAGDTSAYHAHGEPTLYVVLSPVKMRNQDLGAEWVDLDPAKGPAQGALFFKNYHDQPQTHRVQNVDSKTFQVIGVMNNGDGASGTAAPVAGQAPEVDNQWFSAWRTRLPAGETTAAHHHAHPVLIVQVGAGDSVVVERGGPGAEKTVAGTWSVHDAGVEHQLMNIGRSEVELVEIEMK